MSAPRPLISVVVPTLNAISTLPNCLGSLADQDLRDFEVVICDGASTDGTVEEAQRWVARVPRLVVGSQRDGGIYQAINRGIGLSSGRWILILGADDRLAATSTLADAARALSSTKARFVYGDVRLAVANFWAETGARHPGLMDAGRLFSTNICQQSVFYRRDLFKDHGLFRVEYRVCADWEMALRVFAVEPAEWINLIVAEYAGTGMSARTPDLRFSQDKPFLVAKLVLKRPFDGRFIEARHSLASAARNAAREGGWRAQAACLWATAQWLAVLGRLQRARRFRLA
jgi:glycosyltransferase involved in cell wall biosynthesis